MPQPRLAVAVSGGRDSTALLHCTLRQAQPLGIEVWAFHVHHGLMPQADAWLQQVQRQARRWGARFDSRRLQGQPARGDSVEAWARAGRYEALAEMAREPGCKLVLLAHHRLDQAETFLLQALRGAGVAGLSAMPTVAQRQGLVWARPWLDTDPQAIASYVRRQRLQHVQDPSNADPAFLRSRLRQQLWPTLAAAFPQTQAALAAAAGHAQEAHALAMEVAAIDLQGIASGHGMRLSAWRQLSPARQRNALRAWLHGVLGGPPPRTLMDRLVLELAAPQALAWPAPGGQLRRQINLRAQPSGAVSPSSRSCVRGVLSAAVGGVMVADESCVLIRSNMPRPRTPREAGLRVTLADCDDPVVVGHSTTLICTVVNTGAMSTGRLDLTVVLPERATLVGDPSPSRVRIDGANVSFDSIPSIPPGGQATMELAYRIPVSGTAKATAILTGTELDGSTDSNCQTTFLAP